MSDITMIGLGSMGSALARAMLKSGHSVTVWNRSPQKAQELVSAGALAAVDLVAAITASKRIMVCVADYEATDALLGDPQIRAVLAGRTIIQLSTGTPKQASDAQDYFASLGATYRDGSILVWPRNIGSPEALVLVSGPQDVFDDAKPFLDALAGDLRYTGANIRGACALDLAYLSRLTANIFGTIHGAYLCESEGVPVQKLADLLPDGDRGQYLIEAMQNDFDVSGGGATVDVAWAAVSRIAMQANDAGINSEFPDLLASLAERARAAGYGAQETAAIIKVLRAHEKS